MMKKINILLVLLITVIAGCTKEKGSFESDKDIKGVWILKGTNGVGPGSKLEFSVKNGTNIVSFDCSGSPGPNWPLKAETPCKFENSKLSYVDYERPANGYFQVTSFKWVVKGKEFSVKFHQVLLYVSSDYIVHYIKQ